MTRLNKRWHNQTAYHRRIRPNARPNYGYVDPATLRPIGQSAQARKTNSAGADERRTVMTKEDLTVHNIRDASTIVLLTMRARKARAQYKRYWDVLMNLRPAPFVGESPAGEGTDQEKEARLRRYVDDHLVQIDRLRARIEVSASAKYRLKLANRSGGPRHRSWEARNEAVLNELLWRDRVAKERIARANNNNDTETEKVNFDNAPTSPSALFPVQYAIDNQRIEDEMNSEEYGLRKITRKDKLVAARVQAIQNKDWETARNFQDQHDQLNEFESRKRSAKKGRKKIIKECHRKYQHENLPSDPNSGDEVNGPTTSIGY